MKKHTDFLKEDKTILMALKAKYFQYENRKKVIKILTPKQTLQRLKIALTQVKVGNIPENLLNEIHQIIFLY